MWGKKTKRSDVKRWTGGTSVLEDVFGCHGEKRCSSGDPWKRTAGAGDVDMRVGKRLFRVHSMLRERKSVRLVIF